MVSVPRWLERYIEAFFGENDIPTSSGDIDHDDTTGGTAGNPHADSAAVSDVSSIQSSSDVDHDSTQGGTAGNPHADSAAVSDVSSIQSSSDVDHNATSNRTHEGDDLSPDTLEATGTFTDPAGNEYEGRVGKTTEQVQDDAIIWSDGYAPNFAGGSN